MSDFPKLLTETEQKELLAKAEQLWHHLQKNDIGGYSGINRPFYILWYFKEVIEKYGGRDIGLHWTQIDLERGYKENKDEK